MRCIFASDFARYESSIQDFDAYVHLPGENKSKYWKPSWLGSWSHHFRLGAIFILIMKRRNTQAGKNAHHWFVKAAVYGRQEEVAAMMINQALIIISPAFLSPQKVFMLTVTFGPNMYLASILITDISILFHPVHCSSRDVPLVSGVPLKQLRAVAARKSWSSRSHPGERADATPEDQFWDQDGTGVNDTSAVMLKHQSGF